MQQQVAQQHGSCFQLSLVGFKVSITLVRSTYDFTIVSLKSSGYLALLAMSAKTEKDLQDLLSHPILP